MGHPTTTPPLDAVPSDTSKRLRTLSQVSQETGIPRRTLQRAVANGTLRAIRFADGGKCWVEQKDVDRMKQVLRRKAGESPSAREADGLVR